jgi:hypothetical protein
MTAEREVQEFFPTSSFCEAFGEAIELGLNHGRNAMAIWRDMVSGMVQRHFTVFALRFPKLAIKIGIYKEAGGASPCRLPPDLDLRVLPGKSIVYAALSALLGSLPSSVFPLVTFTLICFGLASAFFASLTFSTPLS